jgi:hypothetical protein
MKEDENFSSHSYGLRRISRDRRQDPALVHKGREFVDWIGFRYCAPRLRRGKDTLYHRDSGAVSDVPADPRYSLFYKEEPGRRGG